MKRLSSFFVRLYPAAWRRRYEAELNALLEDVNGNWRTPLNVLKGAISMHLRSATSVKIIMLAGLADVLAGVGFWCVIPSQYVSTAVLKIVPSQAARQQDVVNEMNALVAETMTNRSLGEIIDKRRLYPGERMKVPLEALVSEFKRGVRVQPAGSDTVSLEFKYVDPALAQSATEDLLALFADPFVDNRTNPRSFTLEVLDAPSLTEKPVSPSPVRLAVLGLIGGVLIGLTAALIRRLPAII